ncbi:MAG: hypothetical protein ACK5MB_13660, partial [Phycisphaerales bacterium]
MRIGTPPPRPSFARRAPALAIALCALVGPIAMAKPVYQTAFVAPAGSEWSVTDMFTAPNGETFLGPLSNQRVELTIPDLPEHTHALVGVDLHIIGPWAGNGNERTSTPPSSMVIEIVGGDAPLLSATLANDDPAGIITQNYPDPSRPVFAGAGAYATNALGLASPNTTFRMLFPVKHSGRSITISFTAAGLPPGATWGLDNCVVEVFDMQLATDSPSGNLVGKSGLSIDPLVSGRGGMNANPPVGSPATGGGGGGGG